MSKIKKDFVNSLLASGLLKPYYVIDHSYTDGGMRERERAIISTDNILPCITTRPDTMGVVVIDEEE